ncbi:PREDICTED: sphingosine kinase 1 [Mesitornis unicolor]|uniref:sphingosine kinase 1 n=1 Tax=Mesitornis unicolor TaxID=54374 RepID=UPI000528804F|nr:PREDICTED: sphingosine kinase 1 [Mesitornis unicolor]
MLADADIATTLFITERPHHAHEKVRDEDLSQWDVLVIMSGDGLLYEVVNGIMERPDWEDTLKKPLCILPGGSGNALAASINHYAGNDDVAKKKLLTNCTFILCKGLHTQMDLVSLSTASAHWTVVPEEEFVFVYAIYQSHLGTNLLMAPAAGLHDGCMHLFYLKAGVSRVTLLKLFLAMARGTHLDLNCPHLHYVPVQAFRLEPWVAAGIMTVDGGGPFTPSGQPPALSQK